MSSGSRRKDFSSSRVGVLLFGLCAAGDKEAVDLALKKASVNPVARAYVDALYSDEAKLRLDGAERVLDRVFGRSVQQQVVEPVGVGVGSLVELARSASVLLNSVAPVSAAPVVAAGPVVVDVAPVFPAPAPIEPGLAVSSSVLGSVGALGGPSRRASRAVPEEHPWPESE